MANVAMLTTKSSMTAAINRLTMYVNTDLGHGGRALWARPPSLHLLSTDVPAGLPAGYYWVLSVRNSYMPQFWLTKTFFRVGGR
ncbi:hypothetical protein GCM10010486_29960 [Nonomuraea roseoviolacea subsp. carminata]